VPRLHEMTGGKSEGMTPDDLAKHHKVPLSRVEAALKKGVKVEAEHTDDRDIAYQIARDHVYEDPDYYDKLAKMEKNETLNRFTLALRSRSIREKLRSTLGRL